MSDERHRFLRGRAPEPPRREPEPKLSRTAQEAREAREAEVLPFRRSPAARRVRRMRRHWIVRWLQPLAVAFCIVATPVSVLAWGLRSPHFDVDEVRLSADSPSQRVDAEWVRARLTPFEGMNLWRLDLEGAAREVEKHPWVDDVGIRKEPPSTLVVRVVERREAALYRDPSGLWYVDTHGRPVAPLGRGEDRGGLPILVPGVERPHAERTKNDGEADAAASPLPARGVESPELRAAVELLEELESAGPAWAEGLDEVEILSTRDFRVRTASLPYPLLVRAGTVAHRSHRFAVLKPWIERLGELEAVDLRFARRIVVERETAGEREPVEHEDVPREIRDETQENIPGTPTRAERGAEILSAAADLEAT